MATLIVFAVGVLVGLLLGVFVPKLHHKAKSVVDELKK